MSFGGGKKEPESLWRQFALSGLSGCSAAICTHPFDTIKVRMQLSNVGSQKGADAALATKEGLATTGKRIIATEGAMTLYKGLSASLLRQATYTTTRIGLYLYLKDTFTTKSSPLPVYMKIALSMMAGAGGALVGSPADVVLVRMQADGKLPKEQRRNYKHAMDGLIKIVQNEGVFSLWRGVGPNIGRAMLMTAGQVASYDQAKEMLITKTTIFKDNIFTHFTASLIAGFVAASITSPVDVVKTRIMSQRKSSNNEIQYKNSLDCFMKIVKYEGIRGLYKGFIPYFTRLGPHTILTFIFFEQFATLFDFMGWK